MPGQSAWARQADWIRRLGARRFWEMKKRGYFVEKKRGVWGVWLALRPEAAIRAPTPDRAPS